MKKLTHAEKSAIKQAMSELGVNGKARLSPGQECHQTIYTAWRVYCPAPGGKCKGQPVNYSRHLPGGVTVGEVLEKAREVLS